MIPGNAFFPAINHRKTLGRSQRFLLEVCRDASLRLRINYRSTRSRCGTNTFGALFRFAYRAGMGFIFGQILIIATRAGQAIIQREMNIERRIFYQNESAERRVCRGFYRDTRNPCLHGDFYIVRETVSISGWDGSVCADARSLVEYLRTKGPRFLARLTIAFNNTILSRQSLRSFNTR